MTYEAKNVEDYIQQIPRERQEVFRKLLEIINDALPEGFQQVMQYKMPSWVVPLTLYPSGYHCEPGTPLPFISIASQKQSLNIYHMGLYSFPSLDKWFRKEYASLDIGKLNMGKSCIRFRNLNKIPFDLLSELFSKITPSQYIEVYELNKPEGK